MITVTTTASASLSLLPDNKKSTEIPARTGCARDRRPAHAPPGVPGPQELLVNALASALTAATSAGGADPLGSRLMAPGAMLALMSVGRTGSDPDHSLAASCRLFGTRGDAAGE